MKSLSLFAAVLSFLIILQSTSGGEGVVSKKVVMIIAKNEFRDEELLQPKAVLEGAGIEVVVASSSSGTATGMLGARVEVQDLIGNINPSDYDAVIFVGGRGSSEYWQDPTAHSIAKKANELGKLVCAICIAPVTLAKAGLLSGKRATVWQSEVNALKQAGAFYTGKAVEVDGNIITGNGPPAAEEFGKTILGKLKK